MNRFYIGAKEIVKPDTLDSFDEMGIWVCEEKKDGNWAQCEVSHGALKNLFFSRTGKDISEDDKGVQELMDWKLPEQLNGSILIGEIMLGTQSALNEYQKNGYRQFQVFDNVSVEGSSMRSYSSRRAVLERTWKDYMTDEDKKRFPLVRRVWSGFRAFYDKVVAEGGEGVMLKRKESTYEPKYMGASQKSLNWVKVKKENSMDYVVIDFGIGKKTGEISSFICGLYVDGELKPIMKATLQGELYEKRNDLKKNELLGSVVEVTGFDVFKSGAVRSGQVTRLRKDKTAEECVWIKQ